VELVRGAVVDVPPGVAEDDPAFGLGGAVSGAIFLKLASGAVRLPVVQFDQDALISPHGVCLDRDLFQFDRCVVLRRWQVCIQDQGSEAVFQLASCFGHGFGGSGDGSAQFACAAFAVLEHSLQLGEVDEPEEVGLSDRSVDLVWLCDGGEVDERALWGGAWDGSVFRAFARVER
jgi:hypothetical protein